MTPQEVGTFVGASSRATLRNSRTARSISSVSTEEMKGGDRMNLAAWRGEEYARTPPRRCRIPWTCRGSDSRVGTPKGLPLAPKSADHSSSSFLASLSLFKFVGVNHSSRAIPLSRRFSNTTYRLHLLPDQSSFHRDAEIRMISEYGTVRSRFDRVRIVTSRSSNAISLGIPASIHRNVMTMTVAPPPQRRAAAMTPAPCDSPSATTRK